MAAVSRPKFPISFVLMYILTEKGCTTIFFIIKIHILAKFHDEIMIFEGIRGHLVILPFYRAQTRDSEGPLRKKAIKFEVDVLDTPNFHRICLI